MPAYEVGWLLTQNAGSIFVLLASGTDKYMYLQEVRNSFLQCCNTLAEHESDSIPMGPTGAWWKRPLRAACSILWWRSGCQEPNKVSLFWRLPCRSLSCRWSAPTLFVASVKSVLQVQSRNNKGRIQVRQFCQSDDYVLVTDDDFPMTQG